MSKLLTTLNPCSETASLNKRKASTVHDSKRAARRYHSGQTVASCALVYTGVGTGARLVLRARPAAARMVTRISGMAVVAIGVVLLAERVLR